MNKIEKIYQLLRNRVENHEFAPGSRFPSEYRLAEEYGVDKKTANAAVSLLVTDGFLKRGQRGAGTIVVKQNIFPRGYLAFTGAFSAYNTRILNGVQQTALASGYAVTVFFSEEAEMRLHLEALRFSAVKGVITAGYAGLLVHQLNLPVVHVDVDMNGKSEGVYINTDNRKGACELMREVLRRGHRNIRIYCGGRQFQVRQERVAGFLDAMREWEISSPETHIAYGAADSITDAKAFLLKIRREKPQTTIVLCDGDDTAQSLLSAAFQTGLHVPEDLCITSYGNTLSPFLPIASVEQYPEKLGALACSKLMDGIESGKMPVRMQTELVKPDITGTDYIPDLSLILKKRH